MRLLIRILDAELPVARAKYRGDAGLDLRARVDVVLPPGGRSLIPTGLAVEIPTGHVGWICPRSGRAHQSGVTVLNAPGVIDAGYRGELKVLLINHDPSEAATIHRGERIAQLVVTSAPSLEVELVDELPPSDRDTLGFGSSGID